MKRKLLVLLLSVCMVGGTVAGCGETKDDKVSITNEDDKMKDGTDVTDETSDEQSDKQDGQGEQSDEHGDVSDDNGNSESITDMSVVTTKDIKKGKTHEKHNGYDLCEVKNSTNEEGMKTYYLDCGLLKFTFEAFDGFLDEKCLVDFDYANKNDELILTYAKTSADVDYVRIIGYKDDGDYRDNKDEDGKVLSSGIDGFNNFYSGKGEDLIPLEDDFDKYTIKNIYSNETDSYIIHVEENKAKKDKNDITYVIHLLDKNTRQGYKLYTVADGKVFPHKLAKRIATSIKLVTEE